MRRQARLLAERLARGERVAVLAGGQSMRGLIEYGDGIVIAPCRGAQVREGDIVFARVRRRYLVHRVGAVRDAEVLIGDNLGHLNGWTPHERIYGIVVEVCRGGFGPGHPLGTQETGVDGEIG